MTSFGFSIQQYQTFCVHTSPRKWLLIYLSSIHSFMPSFQPRDQTRLLSVTWLPTVKIFCEGNNSPFPLNGLIERAFSHIGHSPETNFTQLIDLVKRRRTYFCRYCTPTYENVFSASTFAQWTQRFQIHQSGDAIT